jgi:hypothetical protein
MLPSDTGTESGPEKKINIFAFCAFKGFLAHGAPVPLLGVRSGLDPRCVRRTDDYGVFVYFDRTCIAFRMQQAAI